MWKPSSQESIKKKLDKPKKRGAENQLPLKQVDKTLQRMLQEVTNLPRFSNGKISNSFSADSFKQILESLDV